MMGWPYEQSLESRLMQFLRRLSFSCSWGVDAILFFCLFVWSSWLSFAYYSFRYVVLHMMETTQEMQINLLSWLSWLYVAEDLYHFGCWCACACVCVCAGARAHACMCACDCMCVQSKETSCQYYLSLQIHTHTHTHTHTNTNSLFHGFYPNNTQPNQPSKPTCRGDGEVITAVAAVTLATTATLVFPLPDAR